MGVCSRMPREQEQTKERGCCPFCDRPFPAVESVIGKAKLLYQKGGVPFSQLWIERSQEKERRERERERKREKERERERKREKERERERKREKDTSTCAY